MAKNNVTEWDTTAANNQDIGGISILGTAPASNLDNAEREMMAQLRTAMNSGNLMGSGFVAKSGSYTMLTTDRGKIFDCSASLTLSMQAAATLGAGWMVFVKANGGNVTIDPNGAETIGPSTTYIVRDGCTVLVVCTGSAFQVGFIGKATTTQTLTVGSGTYTTASGAKRILIEAFAGGGGGGYSKPNASQSAVGGGGGAGQYIRHWITDPDATYSYTVGAGGAGGVASTSTVAGSGSDTTFGSVVTARGGKLGGSSGSATITGGSAGGGNGGGRDVSGVGDIAMPGEPGGPGVIYSGSICMGGAGGSSMAGGGGKAQFGAAGGQNGTGYAAGGSGGANSNSSESNGGAGADGIIFVREFYQ